MATLLPCPLCGSTDLEEEATGASEIYGHTYQDCWIECKNCQFEGPTLELTSKVGSMEYSDVRLAWNSIPRD